MSDLLPILIPVGIVIIAAAIVIPLLLKGKKTEEGNGKKFKGKDRNAVIKEANRRLAQNPKDAEALLALADLYYREGIFDKSMRSYELLIDLCATNPEIDEFDVTTRYALSAMKLKKYDEAYKSLLIARSMKPDVFEINYNLGYLEYQKKNYEKAAKLLLIARKDQPEHVETLRYLGMSLYKLQKYRKPPHSCVGSSTSSPTTRNPSSPLRRRTTISARTNRRSGSSPTSGPIQSGAPEPRSFQERSI
jgi:tetratricopeptide (TPR) repeat protein